MSDQKDTKERANMAAVYWVVRQNDDVENNLIAPDIATAAYYASTHYGAKIYRRTRRVKQK